MQQKIVNFVRKNKLFDMYSAFTQSRNKVHRLRKINIAIIIPVDEQHRRLPALHRTNRRRFVGKFGQLGKNIFAIPIVSLPIVHAVHIHAGDFGGATFERVTLGEAELDGADLSRTTLK